MAAEAAEEDRLALDPGVLDRNRKDEVERFVDADRAGRLDHGVADREAQAAVVDAAVDHLKLDRRITHRQQHAVARGGDRAGAVACEVGDLPHHANPLGDRRAGADLDLVDVEHAGGTPWGRAVGRRWGERHGEFAEADGEPPVDPRRVRQDRGDELEDPLVDLLADRDLSDHRPRRHGERARRRVERCGRGGRQAAAADGDIDRIDRQHATLQSPGEPPRTDRQPEQIGAIPRSGDARPQPRERRGVGGRGVVGLDAEGRAVAADEADAVAELRPEDRAELLQVVIDAAAELHAAQRCEVGHLPAERTGDRLRCDSGVADVEGVAGSGVIRHRDRREHHVGVDLGGRFGPDGLRRGGARRLAVDQSQLLRVDIQLRVDPFRARRG